MISEVVEVYHGWGFGGDDLKWELGEADLEKVGEACPSDCGEADAEQDPIWE